MTEIPYLIFISIFMTIALCEGNHHDFKTNKINKITVMASQAKPFVFRKEESINGMEIEMINNFAKTFKLHVDYIIANESLKEVFSDRKQTKRFLKSIENL